MNVVEKELTDLRDEVYKMIDFEKTLENLDSSKIGNLSFKNLLPCIKASIILMIYNAVESTCTKCLIKIHEKINEKQANFNSLNDKLKKIVLSYYNRLLNSQRSANDFNVKISYELEKLDFIMGNSKFFLTFQEMSKFYSLYSGNLDAKEIRSTLEKYDIDFSETNTELQTIKKDRNNLAHGAKTFEDVGREKSYQQLQKMAEKSFSFLENMIKAVRDYLDNEKFLKKKTTMVPNA